MAESGLRLVDVTIQSGDAVHRFTAEVAQSAAEQEQGLMHRRSLGPDRAMIFPYQRPQNASFWMKNTLIPLDIIFIRPDGTIARIAERTEPMSLEPIPSLEPISAVLEIAGGRAEALGIAAGDRVSWPR